MAGAEGRRTRQDLYLEISRDLTDDEVENIRSYIGGRKVLPAGTIQHATTQQIFNKLERKGVLKRGDLSFLAKLMESIDRMDYADAANETAKQEREALEERPAKENDSIEPISPGAQIKVPTLSAAGKQRREKIHEKKPYSVSRSNTTQTAGSAEDLEDLIKQNYPLLTKRLQVSDLFPHLIQKGLLQIHEKEDINSKTTGQGKAEALLDLLSRQGKCTGDEFVEILRLGNHEHVVGQLK
ncbi:Hypp523 [Branchiostoma lanceolatum]|uniref:Hypp523 protein n=1 Tax=Branchiostoma lanceolatum TaxID=7740 RepID=A0A8J9VAI7_BRALA|nr:Hypp523 [Branchiostoma lanceolatum]